MWERVASVPPLGAGSCQVWWARATDADASHQPLLDAAERDRRAAYRRAADRDRFTVGVALSRLVLGELLGIAPDLVAIDRSCPTCGEPHGPPRVTDGPRLSVSHSGDRVALALCGDAAVGVDVEQRRERLDAGRLGDAALAPTERTALAQLPAPQRADALLVLWTRKEAVLKVTGDGLTVEPTAVTVTAAGEPPGLVAFAPRPELVGAIALADLQPGAGYRAALAALCTARPTLRELDASALLTS